MIRQIERFPPELDGLVFANPERPSQSHVDASVSWTENVVDAEIPIGAWSRRHKSLRIDPQIDVLNRGQGVRQYLIGPLRRHSGKGAIHTCRDAEILAGASRAVTAAASRAIASETAGIIASNVWGK